MIVRRLASRRLVKRGSTEEEPRRKRAVRFLIFILGSGIFAGAAAAIGIWPFGSLQTLYAEVFPANGAPALAASTVFPSAQPIQKTVDVYASPKPWPPAYTSRPAPAPPPPQQSPEPQESPEPGDQ
ncbi:MAG TPA: hypothetical protein VFR33_06965 [Candidatus Dormibacteraeota bacterium]|nr:hypothetical protein [Candidatus Dormibacteraeota bacterium]